MVHREVRIAIGVTAAIICGTASAVRAVDCTEAALLRVRLNDNVSRRESRTKSGFTIRVVKDDPGWEVRVFAPADRRQHDNTKSTFANGWLEVGWIE